jgi:hypothetical protein
MLGSCQSDNAGGVVKIMAADTTGRYSANLHDLEEPLLLGHFRTRQFLGT